MLWILQKLGGHPVRHTCFSPDLKPFLTWSALSEWFFRMQKSHHHVVPPEPSGCHTSWSWAGAQFFSKERHSFPNACVNIGIYNTQKCPQNCPHVWRTRFFLQNTQHTEVPKLVNVVTFCYEVLAVEQSRLHALAAVLLQLQRQQGELGAAEPEGTSQVVFFHPCTLKGIKGIEELQVVVKCPWGSSRPFLSNSSPSWGKQTPVWETEKILPLKFEHALKLMF